MEPVPGLEVVRWAETLSGMARTGLAFTHSLYERERFEEVLRVAADMRVAATQPDAEAVQSALLFESWLESVGEGVPGYVTPKSAVGAVVGDPEGRLLLVQRRDSGYWLYPTGWADVGYSPSEVALKEVAEETGVDAEVERLFGVFDPFRFGLGRVPFYLIVFLCRSRGGELRGHPLETSDVGWFTRDRLPAPLAMRTDWVDLAFRAINGERLDSWFDPPRTPPWREDERPSAS